MESNYNDEYMKRKEKIFVVNYFDKKEMQWYEEEVEVGEGSTREKFINILTGEEYNTLDEANIAKINFIKQVGKKPQVKSAEEEELPEIGEEKKKELGEGPESKSLEEAKKIGVNEAEEEGEIEENPGE